MAVDYPFGRGTGQRLWAILVVVLGTASATACDALPFFGPDVNAVEINPADPSDLVSFGETIQLDARAVDEDGEAVSDVSIRWSSSDSSIATVTGNGLVTAASNGIATITAAAVDEDGISADVQITVRQEAAALVLQSGGDQTALAGAFLTDPIRFRVDDARGNPVAGATLDFAVREGGGSVSPDQATTDAGGQATATWRLGDDAVAQSLRVSAEGPTDTLTLSVAARVDTTRLFYLEAPSSASPGDVIEVVLRSSLEGIGGQDWGAILGTLAWDADALQPLSISVPQANDIGVQHWDGSVSLDWAVSRPENSAANGVAARLSFEVLPTTATELGFDLTVTDVIAARTLSDLQDQLSSIDATLEIVP